MLTELASCVQCSEALQQLSDIITSFEASYEASEDSSGEAEFAPVLNATVEPFIEAVKRSSEALSAKAPTRSLLSPNIWQNFESESPQSGQSGDFAVPESSGIQLCFELSIPPWL